MVTSSAVVGSSASTSAGLHSSARAMPTRCFMPPLSSCGNCRSRAAGSVMPTRPSSSTTRASAPLPADLLVPDQDLAELRADGEHRVERGGRVLEHHRDAPAAQRGHRGERQRQHVLPLEADLAAGDDARRAAAPGAAAPGWTWSCRCRIRRPCPASRWRRHGNPRRRPRAPRRRACGNGPSGLPRAAAVPGSLP